MQGEEPESKIEHSTVMIVSVIVSIIIIIISGSVLLMSPHHPVRHRLENDPRSWWMRRKRITTGIRDRWVTYLASARGCKGRDRTFCVRASSLR